MTISNSRTIPLVDLRDFISGNKQQKQQFIDDLSSAFHNIGFVGVVGHGIPKKLITDFYTSAKQFFSLPKDKKLKYEIPGAAGQRGYTSFGKEHAKGSNFADLKEFYQVGQEIPVMDKDDCDPFIEEVPEFNTLSRNLYKEFEIAGNHLLKAIAIHLDLPEEYFTSLTNGGISILRAIHYPPITEEPKNAIRAEQHEDINLITLLVGASAGGLQLKNQKGEWMDVVPENEEIVINVGDMLQRLTNNYLKSTTHRVINPPREEWHKPRLSIPFFLHPVPTTSLAVLENCITEENPIQYPPTTAIEYLNERLREIGLKM